MLNVSDISFAYKKNTILNHVSFQVVPGDCVGIIGTNGCGKSTLLSIIAGALIPKSGTITLNHYDIKKNPKEFSRFIGYVPQDNALIPELSVKDNLRFWFQGSKQNFDALIASGELSFFGVHNFYDKKVSELSGGMKKRVSLACAFSNKPAIFILDEPSTALDPQFKKDMFEYLNTFINKHNGTIIITSHEWNELNLCNKLFFLKDGSLQPINSSLTREALINLY
ncbi:MAG: ABC transporter ATP-binding protein [Lachnospiraceae bacterium]|nr:ABC transporter ATP-binding protein [Lachnospiraceae bacterium]